MSIQVVGHTSFLGTTGYAQHSQNFFVNLNNYIPTRIRNFSHIKNLSDFEKKHSDLLIEQTWSVPPYKVGKPFKPNPSDTIVNLVLNESHHYYFYDAYDSPKIAYNVWESTKQIPQFFDKILEYDQFWCPTQWQKTCTIKQGYPENKIKVVPEAVDGSVFFTPNSNDEQEKIRKKLYKKYNIPEDAITFMIFGRWDYRKAITETIQAFNEEFKNNKEIYLILSVDNPFPSDGLKTTEERLEKYKLQNENIRILHFPEKSEYVEWLQSGHIFLSCARSEGWNLPLMEAIACGTPVICSGWSGQLEFANIIAHKVNIEKFLPPKNVYMIGDNFDLGHWAEPDFNHLRKVMRNVLNNYADNKLRAVKYSSPFLKKYTWDNAAKIANQYIQDLVKIFVAVPEKLSGVKLNLGCGNVIKPGYINIDKYNNTNQVDMKLDIKDLTYFKDETVEEIYTSHVFEHIGLNDMYSVLAEWKRVLQVGGRLVLYLPDLETEVKEWLNTPDDKKWQNVHKIFGAQTHPGDIHYCGFNCGSLKLFLQSFNFRILKIGLGDRGFGKEIQCTAIKLPNLNISKPNIICHFVDGPFIDIQGDSRDKSYYQVEFLDVDNNAVVHSTTLGINQWTRPHRIFYTNWLVKVRQNGKYIYEHKLDLTGKNVLISFDSKSLGDTIAWFPQVEEFRKKYNCNVIVSTFWNHLFKNNEPYKNIQFIEPGNVAHNLYASYKIGCYDNDLNKNKIAWSNVPLQKVCSDILGLEYKEIICDINFTPKNRPITEKYVTISEHSTFQCKYWNYPNGWQIIVDYLNSIGYKAMVVSKEATQLKNIIDMTNKPIEDSMNNIYHSEFLMTVSTGPAWIAWALRKHVVVISGSTDEITEFKSNISRVINKDVCHGCFNKENNNFDRGDWNWCPFNKGTDKQFECTKEITPDTVKNVVNRILYSNFYIPEFDDIRNLYEETRDFTWDNFKLYGPAKTAYYEIFIQEDYKRNDCRVEDGDFVIDIGANIGIFTRYACCNGAKKILAFEPEKRNYEYLLKNKTENCECFNMAVSNNCNVEKLIVSDLSGSHTLIEQDDNVNNKLQEIQCITLDEIIAKNNIDKIDFLKVDTEGAELKIFEGISDENLLKIRKISMEYHHMIFNFNEELREKFIQRFVKLEYNVYILHLKSDHLNMFYFWK